jgi:hypothetical protein
MKIPDCNRCLFYSHQPDLVCAVHPSGVEGDNCPDFRPDHDAEPEELWCPEGYSWDSGELVPNKRSRLTQENPTRIEKLISISNLTLVVYYTAGKCWQYAIASTLGSLESESIYYTAEAAEREGREQIRVLLG